MKTNSTGAVSTYGILTALIGCAFSSLVNAGVIVDRPPIEWWGGPGADTAFYGGPDSVPEWELSADYFELASPDSISLITWYGFYGSTFGGGSWDPPHGDEVMRIRFYDARLSDGLPGSVLFEESFLNPKREVTGMHTDDGQLLYRFQTRLDVEFSALPDRRYWLEIVQVDDIDSCYRWSFGESNTTLAYFNLFYTDWRYHEFQGGLAFTLESVPEPQVFVIVGVIALCQRLGGRRLLPMTS